MQNELSAQYPLLRITLGGINQAGHQSGNSAILPGRDLPFLQDADANQNGNGNVWEAWQAEWRDVVIVGGSSEKLGVYNLTTHDLSAAANFAELKGLLIDAAMSVQKPWQNARDRFDVDDDHFVVSMDALRVINSCNSDGPRELAPPTGTQLAAPYYDVDGDSYIAPIDALLILNYLNAQPGGEGESPLNAGDARAEAVRPPLASAHDQVFEEFAVGGNDSFDRSDDASWSATGSTEPVPVANAGSTRTATLFALPPSDVSVRDSITRPMSRQEDAELAEADDLRLCPTVL